MPNRYDESLRVELRQRYLRLYKTSAADLQKHMKYFRDWVAKHQTLELLFAAAEASDSGFDPNAWIADQQPGHRGDYELPDSEVGLARVGWAIVNKLADQEMSTTELLAFSSERNYNDAATEVVGSLIEPMFDYVESRLSFGDELLHLLARYRDRVAWFDRAALLERYTADTGRGEANLDADLRRFIFEQGHDYPFAQPRGRLATLMFWLISAATRFPAK